MSACGQALRPTMFIGVPRVFDRLYAGINERLASAGAFRRLLFKIGYWLKLRGLRRGLLWDTVGVQADSQGLLLILICTNP